LAVLNDWEDEYRLIAKAMLEMKGLNLDKPGSSVRLSHQKAKKFRR
jgi:hypothetical protein